MNNLLRLTIALMLVTSAYTAKAQTTLTVDDFINLYNEMHDTLTVHNVSSPDLNVLRYMRTPRYNAGTWSIVCGNTSDAAKPLLAIFDTRIEAIKYADMKLPNGDLVDCIHFAANLNGYVSGHGDLTGWAGDLVEYSPGYADKTFPDNANFSIMDYNADLDAYNVFHSEGNTVRERLYNYYISSEGYRQRATKFVTGNDIYTRFSQSGDKTFLNLLMFQKGTNTANIQGAAAKMDAYINSQVSAEAASISNLTVKENHGTIFTLSGNKIGNIADPKNLPSGLYIIDGQKIHIK